MPTVEKMEVYDPPELEYAKKVIKLLWFALAEIGKPSTPAREWCRSCGWVGVESECETQHYGPEYPMDYDSYCPICGEETHEFDPEEYACQILKEVREL